MFAHINMQNKLCLIIYPLFVLLPRHLHQLPFLPPSLPEYDAPWYGQAYDDIIACHPQPLMRSIWRWLKCPCHWQDSSLTTPLLKMHPSSHLLTPPIKPPPPEFVNSSPIDAENWTMWWKIPLLSVPLYTPSQIFFLGVMNLPHYLWM